ncbi:MAG: DUF1722 domain-containing protein [Deltaproteobacteria bacterium]|nr:DUF1722 domain-containing protein [Deltaproteobacteria bacterium]
MTVKSIKPRIVVSKCLGFAACRYNGLMISSPFVRKLKDHVDFIPVCPEQEIGLGVPRDPIRIIEDKGKRRLFQPATGRDMTAEMNAFAGEFFKDLGPVDGFLLKTRSPSCGIKDVKVYPGSLKGAAPVTGKSSGFFGGLALELYPGRAIEDDGRLENATIREHFLTRIFALACLRETLSSGSVKKLVDFHSSRKLLLMAYSQKEMRALGKLVAHQNELKWTELAAGYQAHFEQALGRIPRPRSHLNVLMHALGYFKDELTPAEKKYFLEQLDLLGRDKIPLSTAATLIGAWVASFKNQYLELQTYFEPYPRELIDISDTGRGRMV